MIFWLIGFVLAVIAGVLVWEEVEIDPHSGVSAWFPAVCGMGVFPACNYFVALVAFILVADSREKRKARREGRIK